MTEEKKQSLQPISRNLCEVYNLLYARGEVVFPLQDIHADSLETIVKTVEGIWFGINRFPTPESKASAYFCLIIKDHPVVDGNKRLAVMWLEIYCKILNLKIVLPKGLTLDVLAVTVEQLKDVNNDQLFGLVKKVLFGVRAK